MSDMRENEREGCHVRLTPLDDGGVDVQVGIPTYEDEAELSIRVERDADGDWRVFIPWPDGLPDEHQNHTVGGYQACAGIVFLGAPDDAVQE